MTTQAQIEADNTQMRKALEKIKAHGPNNTSGYPYGIAFASLAALTAAAEVGESLEPTLIVQGGGAQYGGHTPREEKRIVASTIERCAQRAKDTYINPASLASPQEQIAAAIRAMKDKP